MNHRINDICVDLFQVLVVCSSCKWWDVTGVAKGAHFVFLVRLLREELQLLQEQGSHVGEVIKTMDKKKVLVKVGFARRDVEREEQRRKKES